MRDARERLLEMGVSALGISPDSPAAQKKFSDKLGLNFPILSDAEHRVAEAYGAWGEKSLYGKKSFGITRSSFLVDEKGKIAAAWYNIKPDQTIPRLFEALGIK